METLSYRLRTSRSYAPPMRPTNEGTSRRCLTLSTPTWSGPISTRARRARNPQICHGRGELEIALQRQLGRGLSLQLEELIAHGDQVMVTVRIPGIEAHRFGSRRSNLRHADRSRPTHRCHPSLPRSGRGPRHRGHYLGRGPVLLRRPLASSLDSGPAHRSATRLGASSRSRALFLGLRRPRCPG